MLFSIETIGWIGHSLGTITMFCLLSSKPEYSNVIQPFIALAPNPYLMHSKSYLPSLIRFLDYFKPLTYVIWLFLNYLLIFLVCRTLHLGRLNNFIGNLCENYNLAHYLCQNIEAKFEGFNSDQYNFVNLEKICLTI